MSEPGSSSSRAAGGRPNDGAADGEGASASPASDDPLSRRSPASDDPAQRPHADDDADDDADDEPDAFRVELMLETGDTEPPLSPWLGEQLARLAALAEVRAGSVTLVVVDDARMSELHERYHQDPTTTDVLTFDLRDTPPGHQPAPEPLAGDLVLCLDEASRQAERRNHDVRTELLLYALHGLLHLLGDDDRDPADAERMHHREDELLTRAGFGKVYGG